MSQIDRAERCLLFDWGDTLMRVFPHFQGPMAEWPRVELMPYAREVLEELQKDWTIALATNAANSDTKEIITALKRAGLAEHVDHIFCFHEIGHPKPSTEFFNAILNDLKVDSQSIFMVGDDYHGDILGANQSGLYGIWYNWRSPLVHQNKLHTTIHDLRDLPHALEQVMNKETMNGI